MHVRGVHVSSRLLMLENNVRCSLQGYHPPLRHLIGDEFTNSARELAQQTSLTMPVIFNVDDSTQVP